MVGTDLLGGRDYRSCRRQQAKDEQRPVRKTNKGGESTGLAVLKMGSIQINISSLPRLQTKGLEYLTNTRNLLRITQFSGAGKGLYPATNPGEKRTRQPKFLPHYTLPRGSWLSVGSTINPHCKGIQQSLLPREWQSLLAF